MKNCKLAVVEKTSIRTTVKINIVTCIKKICVLNKVIINFL